jgi:hypothetical protein
VHHKDLKFGVILILIIVVGTVAALVYAEQNRFQVPSPTPQPSATPTVTPIVTNPTATPPTDATLTPEPTTIPTPVPTPTPTTQEQIRNSILSYISTHHAETQRYMPSSPWIGGRVETGVLGSEAYNWQSQNWNVTLTYPVTLTPVYSLTVTLGFNPISESLEAAIAWKGTWQGGTITETSYTFG